MEQHAGGEERAVWLWRHGALAPNPEQRFVGQRDIPLSRSGEAAFARLARDFADAIRQRPRAFFCSDSRRGTACADMLRRAFRPSGGTMPVIADPGFRERSLGAWEGLTRDEVERRWPGALAEHAADPAEYAPPGGESLLMLQRRAVMALARARLHCRGGLLVVVGHASFNRCVLADCLALPLADVMRLSQPYGCRTLLKNR